MQHIDVIHLCYISNIEKVIYYDRFMNDSEMVKFSAVSLDE